MSDQVNIHPIAALAVAERQIEFDKNQKLLLQQAVFEQQEIITAQKSQIDELTAKLGTQAQ